MKRATAIVLALVLAVSLFTACSSGSSRASSGARYKAGTYTVTVDGRNGPLTMEGVFTEDAIDSLIVTSHSETEGISDGAIQDLPQQIVDAQSLQVDAVAGATITSEAVIAAVKDLVEQAGGDVQALENAGTAEYSKAMTAGTYTATARGHHSDVTVEVTVSDEAIESVTVVDDDETYNISDAAIDTVPGRIVKHQSVNVDGVAGATMTSQAILNAVRDCIEQAGGQEAVNAFSVRAGETPSTEEFTMEADVVFAGSGLTGIAAALAAQQEGASVILIEKLPFVGGISQTAAGGIAVPSENGSNVEDYVNFRLNQNAGIFKDTYVEGYPNEAMVRTLAENSYDVLTWLGENGLQYITFDVGYQGYDLTYAVFSYGEEWQAPNVGGYALTALVDRFVENGGTLITECAATNIIMQDGKVAGLKAEGNSGKYTFTCPSVVLATGGFGANEEMVEQYAPAYSGEYNTTMISDTGDAITMGLEVGADVYTSGFMMGGTGHTYMTEADLEATYADHTTPKTSVYLNPLGLRVNSEDPIAYTASACYVNPDGPDYYWAILNEEQAQSTGYIQYIDEIMANGGDAYKADSLVELANMIRMPAANLRYSMNRYNQFCENGVDEDYGKSADYLIKMEEGPWYAVKATMTYFGTVGGLVTNENAEVLTPEGTAIPGLYAAGEASNGGFFNMSYSGGFALSIDATMGRIAGTNAAKLAG